MYCSMSGIFTVYGTSMRRMPFLAQSSFVSLSRYCWLQKCCLSLWQKGVYLQCCTPWYSHAILSWGLQQSSSKLLPVTLFFIKSGLAFAKLLPNRASRTRLHSVSPFESLDDDDDDDDDVVVGMFVCTGCVYVGGITYPLLQVPFFPLKYRQIATTTKNASSPRSTYSIFIFPINRLMQYSTILDTLIYHLLQFFK